MPVTPPPPWVAEEAWWGAGGGARGEELVGGELAVEDVAADQAVGGLHLVRADDLAVEDRGGEARGELLEPRDQPVGVGGEVIGVRRGGEAVRDPLREHRHDVLAARG